MPCIGKPATATSYLTEALVRMIDQSGILPKGALQLVIGSTGDLLDRLDVADVVTFTGSADTAAKLRVNPNVVRNSIPFNAEADSLNCAILADDVTPDDEEFNLFVKEVVREMTVKAGQKCTAIRRAIVPRKHLDAVAEKIKARLAKVVVGDPTDTMQSRSLVTSSAVHSTPPAASHCASTLADASSLVAPRATNPTRVSRNSPEPTAVETSSASTTPPGPPAQAVAVEIPAATTAPATKTHNPLTLAMPPFLPQFGANANTPDQSPRAKHLSRRTSSCRAAQVVVASHD
jgi:acyl-CoA reductase-like NAD-dependent aldehyde dehydrogenase